MSLIGWRFLGIAPKGQLPKKNAWPLYLIGGKAPPSEHSNDGLSLSMRSSQSWLVGLVIQNEAMDVDRSTPQGTHDHVGVIYLHPLPSGYRREQKGDFTPSEASSNSVSDWQSLCPGGHPCILNDVCDAPRDVDK